MFFRSKWLDIGFVLVCVVIYRDFVWVYKDVQESLANIHPS